MNATDAEIDLVALEKFLLEKEENEGANELIDHRNKNKDVPLKAKSTDSSDEDVENFLERKYTEYGCDIDEHLKSERRAINDKEILRRCNLDDKTINNDTVSSFKQRSVGKVNSPVSNKSNVVPSATVTDPIFGFRIIKPLISSALLLERMSGRKTVSFSNIASYKRKDDQTSDWVIAGVLINKSPVRKAKNGTSFSVWRLCDMGIYMKTISLFMFNGAHKNLWKTSEGMCVAVLNPSMLDKRLEGKDVACLCIDTEQKVMILGQSKDFGICKARKENGQACSVIINLKECEYCLYHIQRKYRKMSRRSELQSGSSVRGLALLHKKTLDKPELFYGQSRSAIPCTQGKKLVEKDAKRMAQLSDYAVSPISKCMKSIETPPKEDICNDFNIKNTEVTPSEILHAEFTKILNKNKINNDTNFEKVEKNAKNIGFEKFKDQNIKKINAVEIIKQCPIEKVDPNSFRGSKEGKRRLNEKFESDQKRHKAETNNVSEKTLKIQRIIDAKSSHINLIDLHEQTKYENYFDKLEKKESLEEKMLKTYKIPTKAVTCKQCKYTAFSAAEHCKEEKHLLKVIEAEKRFFQCKDCGNRTVTLFKLPKESCKKCMSSRWMRTSMIRERIVCQDSENLSLRGDEEKFIGSFLKNTNINLLVPDEL